MASYLILNDLIKHLDINIAKFERNIGVPASTIRMGIKRESKLSMDIALKIKTKYPQVDMAWLQTGDGDMLVGKTNDNSKENKNINETTTSVHSQTADNQIRKNPDQDHNLTKSNSQILRGTPKNSHMENQYLEIIKTLSELAKSQQNTIADLSGKVAANPAPNINYKKQPAKGVGKEK